MDAKIQRIFCLEIIVKQEHAEFFWAFFVFFSKRGRRVRPLFELRFT